MIINHEYLDEYPEYLKQSLIGSSGTQTHTCYEQMAIIRLLRKLKKEKYIPPLGFKPHSLGSEIQCATNEQ